VLGVLTSRSGHRVATWGGKALHSRYDPVREARRFAERSLEGLSCAPVVILLGAAAGYVAKALAEDPRVARVLALFLDADMAATALDLPPTVQAWHPRMQSGLYSHLRGAVDESDLARVHLVEWEPAVAALPQQAALCRQHIRQVIGEIKANYATTCATGRLWVRNTLVNFLRLPPTLLDAAPDRARPLVIAASGPSLQKSIEAVGRHRAECDLWALPSAVEPLLFAGLRPDLVVATDAGYYAGRHFDAIHHDRLSLAMPLSAARGAWRFAAGVLPICQPYSFETSLWAAVPGTKPQRIAPQGTVAATAYGLAAASGYSCVIFAGLDLCYQDVVSHARPGLFERVFHAEEGRLRPGHGRMVASALERAPLRRGPHRTSADLQAYGQWFGSHAVSVEATFRLDPPFADDGLFRAVPSSGLGELLKTMGPSQPWSRRLRFGRLPGRHARRAILQQVVAGWIGAAETTRAEGGNPDTWPADVRELAMFCSLPSLARAKAGRGQSNAEPLEDTLGFLRGLIERVA
jgi:hypothetical protein